MPDYRAGEAHVATALRRKALEIWGSSWSIDTAIALARAAIAAWTQLTDPRTAPAMAALNEKAGEEAVKRLNGDYAAHQAQPTREERIAKAKEAVIERLRQWRRVVDVGTHGNLLEAVDALEAAEKPEPPKLMPAGERFDTHTKNGLIRDVVVGMIEADRADILAKIKLLPGIIGPATPSDPLGQRSHIHVDQIERLLEGKP